MGIRVQATELDISTDDPFKDDLLDRKESVEILTSIIGSIDGPCVLAVDAPWGTGKTTFLNMLAQTLRRQTFTVVDFNAWETDFAEDPFVALSSEITAGLKGTSRRVGKLKRAIPEVIRTMRPLLPVAISAIPHAGPTLARVMDEFQADRAGTSTSRYVEGKRAFREFKQALESAATSLAKAKEGKPLVVVIDELDRCRPSYAVALLEVAKHLFTVDRIVFVLAMDRTQLAHSIRVLYGQDFDAKGYLRRFFVVDYRLPDPDRRKFIQGLLLATRIKDYLGDPQKSTFGGDATGLLQDFFSNSELSLRDVSQAIHRLGLVLLASRKNDHASSVTAMVVSVLLLMRAVDPDLYYRFIREGETDKEAVEAMFGRPSFAALRRTPSGYIAEAVLILARASIDSTPYQATDDASPLYKYYKQVATQNSSEPELTHATRVMQWVSTLGPSTRSVTRAIQRIELLSPELKEEDSPIAAS